MLNHENGHGYPLGDMASVFLAATPKLFTSTEINLMDAATLCPSKPTDPAALAEYNETSTVLRCDVHKSTYRATFSFIDGVQNVDIKEVTDITDKPMITIGEVVAYFNSSDREDTTLQPQACPPAETNPNLDETHGMLMPCLLNSPVLSTLSYQAVMHAFIDLVSGKISLGDQQHMNVLSASTTRLQSTVLALAPELAFLQTKSQDTRQTVQQRAVMWNQKPFTGLINDAAEPHSTLPLQQALEQLFQNITVSLMSAPDIQYVHHTIFPI